MDVILHTSGDAPWQQLNAEWFGHPVIPPFEFRFHLAADALVFSARRAAPALLHPESQEGRFQELLWKYDTAEFFVATPEADRYVEFNISPNGAWWAAAFTAPRVVNPNMPAVPTGVVTSGHATPTGWACEARLPLAWLRAMGVIPGTTPCRLAATAILNSPRQVFLTTATNTSGRPDFHHPRDFSLAASIPPTAPHP